jgi:hypothetical protein
MSTRRDILADANGDLAIVGGKVQWATDGDAVLQSVRMRLRLFLGEWFADESAGVLDFTSVFVKNPNLAVLRQRFRECILGTQGVKNLLAYDTSLDKATRTFSVTFRVDTDFGALTSSTSVTL